MKSMIILEGEKHLMMNTSKIKFIIFVTNDVVDAINNKILELLHGESWTFLVASSVVLEADNVYPSEYLNSLEVQSLPPSKLHLKFGCPIIPLQNIAPKEGLCNGCRLIVTRAYKY